MRSSLSFKRGTCHIMRTRNVCLPGFYTIIRVWLIITCGSFIIIYGTRVIMHSTQIIQLRHKSICVVQLNMVQCMCILYGIFGFTCGAFVYGMVHSPSSAGGYLVKVT